MINDREKSTRRLSPRVNVALSRMPSSSFHNESDAFSISSNRTSESGSVFRLETVEILLTQTVAKFRGDPDTLAESQSA